MENLSPSQIISTRSLVQNQGDIVFLQRAATGEFQGSWELPGGKVDPGDTIQTGAWREVKEETGLDVDFINVLPEAIEDRYIHEGKHSGAHYCAFGFVALTEERDIILKPDEHSTFLWLPPDRALKELNLTKTSAAAINKLRPLL